MSQLLSRISKPLVLSNVLRHNNMVRRLCCSSTPIYPFMLIDHVLKVGDSSDGRVERGDESVGEKDIILKDRILAKQVQDTMNSKWIRRVMLICQTENTTTLSDTDSILLYILHEKKVEQRLVRTKEHISFLHLPKGSQIQNLAMSSLHVQNNEDRVLAVKFSGSKLKLLRPATKNSQWIDIQTTHESISPYSSLMYSKKDQRFYVPTPGCNYLCSFDLNFKKNDKPKFVEVRKVNLPEYEPYELEEMNAFTRTDHMVESPFGEQFLISWYYEDKIEYYMTGLPDNHREHALTHITKQFVVFREEEQSTDESKKFMSYTDNIGDLCFFLGRDEALCVRASSCPGLKPNCIYFVGHNYGVYDITTQTCTIFYTEKGPLRSTEIPYWPHPFSLTPN